MAGSFAGDVPQQLLKGSSFTGFELRAGTGKETDLEDGRTYQ